jgi:baseplate J-like protein
MQNIVRLTPESELRAILTETFINNSGGRVTKVSDNSVTAGIVAALARVSKKALKDIALSVSHQFPDSASGTALDDVADNYGIAPRLGSSQSSTYVRVVGSPGTVYTQGVHVVSGNQGIAFDLQGSLTLDSTGFGYIKVRSQQTGSITNVDPYTLVSIAPVPAGHTAVVNEYSATGGRDVEQDDVFRQRIKEGPDILSQDTLSYITQVFLTINSNVLKVNYEGINAVGQVVLSILTQNGVDLTQPELDALLTGAGNYLALTEMNSIGTTSYGVLLKNVTYFPVDVAFRCQLFSNFTLNTVVKNIQVAFSKYVDFRFWDSNTQVVDWTVLLQLARAVDGVKYIPDTYFVPGSDQTIPVNQYPRFRGFKVSDLNGTLIVDQTGVYTNIFYPTVVENNFEITVL